MSASYGPSSSERKLAFAKEHWHVLALFRSWQFWIWCAVALVPACGAAVFRALTSFAAGPVFGGLILALGVTMIIVQSVARGRSITNKGIFLRDAEPVRFWASVGMSVILYGLAVLGILMA